MEKNTAKINASMLKQYLRGVKKRLLYPERYSQCSSVHFFSQKKIIFIHVPKTGGISVLNGLYNSDELLNGFGHTSALFYKGFFNHEYRKYYSFGMVRNPWDRVVSAYEYLHKLGMNASDAQFGREILSRYNNFTEFVERWLTPCNILKQVHFFPQHFFLCNLKGELLVNYVGRFEQIEESFKHISSKMNLNNASLKKLNKSKRLDSYRNYYNENTREVVASCYAQDIKLFNYEF